VAISYLYRNRPGWKPGTSVGKTLVSSSMIDRVAKDLGRRVVEVPVGFKWFVDGLLEGSLGFGGGPGHPLQASDRRCSPSPLGRGGGEGPRARSSTRGPLNPWPGVDRVSTRVLSIPSLPPAAGVDASRRERRARHRFAGGLLVVGGPQLYALGMLYTP
jgi:hypothetical protein